jgi:hypothetical protein
MITPPLPRHRQRLGNGAERHGSSRGRCQVNKSAVAGLDAVDLVENSDFDGETRAAWRQAMLLSVPGSPR